MHSKIFRRLILIPYVNTLEAFQKWQYTVYSLSILDTDNVGATTTRRCLNKREYLIVCFNIHA